jgi:ABC-type Fe2+-enterobactin transport system substrate-binding protein
MTVTDEMVMKALKAINDRPVSMENKSPIRAALSAVAPMLIAHGMREIRDALEAMVAEKADYMIINNLGDPEEQHTIKQARAALEAVAPMLIAQGKQEAFQVLTKAIWKPDPVIRDVLSEIADCAQELDPK